MRPDEDSGVTDDPGSREAPLDAAGGDARSRRVIVYGAETDLGRAVGEALRDAGAAVGVTSARTDGAALFALKRAAAGGPAQAVDLGNATNVRVATRKLAKELGGLDLAVVISGPEMPETARQDVLAIAARELRRTGAGRIVLLAADFPADGPLSIQDVPLDVVVGGGPAADLAALVRRIADGTGGGDAGIGRRYPITGDRPFPEDGPVPEERTH